MRVHAIEAFDDNYIWAIETSNNDTVIIVDPGEAKPVQQWLKQNNKLGGQHKVPRLSNKRGYLEELLILNNSYGINSST